MAKQLSGLELQGFIKERQLRQVRNLRQEHEIMPKLLIIKSLSAGSVIDTYVRMKVAYAEDIGIAVEVVTIPEEEMKQHIITANNDSTIHGIIVQLPLKDKSQINTICNSIDSNKDVDGLSNNSLYPSATAQAIDWLLAGYNVTLEGKRITIVGNGKLVGSPLVRLWKQRGLVVSILDDTSDNVNEVLRASDIIVTATGVPRLIKSKHIKTDAVVVDAGTASESGQIVGDLDPAVRERSDLTITPAKGGVGPLTYTVLFDHLIEACLRLVGKV